LAAFGDQIAAQNRADFVSASGWTNPDVAGTPYGINAASALAQALGLAPHDREWAIGNVIQAGGPVNNLALQDRYAFEWLMNNYNLWQYPKVVEQYNALLPKWEKWGEYEVARVDDSFHIMDLVSAISWGWGLPLAFASIGAAAGVGAEAVASGATALEAPAEAAMLESVAGETSIFAPAASDFSLTSAIDVAKTLYKIESTFASQQDFPTLPSAPAPTYTTSAAATTSASSPIIAVSSSGAIVPTSQITTDAAGRMLDTLTNEPVALVSTLSRYATESGLIVPVSQIAPDAAGNLIDTVSGERVEQVTPEMAKWVPWALAGLVGIVILRKRRHA
jgi:hypothetical protein